MLEKRRNKKGKGKKAQLFLIAALIIIGIIVGLGTIYNYLRTNEEETYVFDLSNEITYESAQLIDSGVFNSISEGDINKSLYNLTSYYAKQNPDSDIAVIYGNTTALRFTCSESLISISPGSESGPENKICNRVGEAINKNNINYLSNKVSIIISNYTYDFDLKSGQSVYMIFIKKSHSKEQYVAAS